MNEPLIEHPVLREFDCLASNSPGILYLVRAWVTRSYIVVRPYSVPCVIHTVYPWNVEHQLGHHYLMENPTQTLVLWGIQDLISEYLEKT